MAPRSQPYRIDWPLTATNLANIDEMFQLLFDDMRNGSLELSLDQITAASINPSLVEFNVGDLIYADTTTSLDLLESVSVGSYLRSAGVDTAPVWSTLKLPNAATIGDIPHATATDSLAVLASVSAGSYLRSAGVATANVWSTLKLPNAATVGDILYSDTTDNIARLADVATGSLLASGGVATAPAWSASPTLTTSLTTPLIIGGTTASSTLSLRSTSGVGTTDAVILQVGNNGATEAMRVFSGGATRIGASGTSVGTDICCVAGTLWAGSTALGGPGIRLSQNEVQVIRKGAGAGTIDLVLRPLIDGSQGRIDCSLGGLLLTPTVNDSYAPIQFQSGTVKGVASAGDMEFATDDLFFTITTGDARKRLLMADDTGGLTSTRVPFTTTNGRLTDDADMTFATDTLTVTKLSTTQVTNSGLTSGRVVIASTGGLLADDADLTFATNTLSATNVTTSGTTSTGALKLLGSGSGSVTITVPAAAGVNTLVLPAGTTDFSATGGSSQVVKQASAGGAFTVAQVTDADLSTSDITTNNATSSKHGFLPKLSNTATEYLDGTGAFSTPAGGGGLDYVQLQSFVT